MFIVWITMVYGILLALGGTMGFVMAGSKASLIAGVGFGVLAFVGAILMLRRMGAIGWGLSLGVTVLVGVYFAFQLFQSGGGDATPRFAGVLLLSAIELGVLILGRGSLPQ